MMTIYNMFPANEDSPCLKKQKNKIKATTPRLPSTEIAESEGESRNSFWRFYEKLTSFCAKYLTSDWMDKYCQDSDKWPYY